MEKKELPSDHILPEGERISSQYNHLIHDDIAREFMKTCPESTPEQIRIWRNKYPLQKDIIFDAASFLTWAQIILRPTWQIRVDSKEEFEHLMSLLDTMEWLAGAFKQKKAEKDAKQTGTSQENVDATRSKEASNYEGRYDYLFDDKFAMEFSDECPIPTVEDIVSWRERYPDHKDALRDAAHQLIQMHLLFSPPDPNRVPSDEDYQLVELASERSLERACPNHPLNKAQTSGHDVLTNVPQNKKGRVSHDK